MFDQCFANVWPKARLSPQTVSNGAVCFAKCKHGTLNTLIHSDLLTFQRRGILNIDLHNQQSNNQPYRQCKFVCMADIFILYNGVLSPQIVEFICIWTAKSTIVCIY